MVFCYLVTREVDKEYEKLNKAQKFSTKYNEVEKDDNYTNPIDVKIFCLNDGIFFK